MITLTFDDATSDLGRPLAADIDKRRLMTNEKSHITSEQYAIDRKLVFNTNRKPLSLYQLVTSLPASDITEFVK
jgi:hypothetical protein